MAEVIFSNVQKSYGETEILKGVDLEASAGEFIVLVGPSGCGKSTLLRLVAGLEDITGGEIRIGSKVVNDVAPRDRGVAMVFQSYALYPHMSVRENLGFGLSIRKEDPKKIASAVEEVAKMLDISGLLDRLPKQLSGGQRQRVAIGRAIVRQPDVFLFDEPLSNLDAALRTQMRVELKKLHKRLKSTMIYVTHDQVEAMTLADRIVVMNAGVVQQVGSPLELFERPSNVFVAGFIGSPGMNFVKLQNGLPEGFEVPEIPDGTDVVGIRPQHLEHWDGHQTSFPMQVEVVESMGWEAHLHGGVGGQSAVAALEFESVARMKFPGEIRLGCDPRHLHFFDSSGVAITSTRPQ